MVADPRAEEILLPLTSCWMDKQTSQEVSLLEFREIESRLADASWHQSICLPLWNPLKEDYRRFRLLATDLMQGGPVPQISYVLCRKTSCCLTPYLRDCEMVCWSDFEKTPFIKFARVRTACKTHLHWTHLRKRLLALETYIHRTLHDKSSNSSLVKIVSHTCERCRKAPAWTLK